jgi:HlyD family secretion protein
VNRKRLRPLIPLVLVAAAVAAFVALRDGDVDSGVVVASGTVEATEADVGFVAGGRITTVLVDEGDRVAAGQPVAHVDAAELEARLAVVTAQVDAARAQPRRRARRWPRRRSRWPRRGTTRNARARCSTRAP